MGVFYFLKKQFRFALQDRLGLLLVVVCIFGSWFVFIYKPTNNTSSLDTQSVEVLKVIQYLDSIDDANARSQRITIYPFNPNFISDYKGYQLGMSVVEIDRLLAFRKQDKWINSTADFKRVTGVSDSLLAVLSPYFKFPEWVKNSEASFKRASINHIGPKEDLNTATAKDLQKVYGIGPTLSKRIVDLRERLQGFSDTLQLRSVYGLSDATRSALLESFELPNPKVISKIEFATASASDLSTIPGISFDLALKMVSFRRLRDSVKLASELLKIDGLSPQKLELISLYLQFE
jgi:DNA uptake protein ComE-like DNA-binding protein